MLHLVTCSIRILTGSCSRTSKYYTATYILLYLYFLHCINLPAFSLSTFISILHVCAYAGVPRLTVLRVS
jgi:hypothetical protein